MKKYSFFLPLALISISLWVACSPNKNDDPTDFCANPPTAEFSGDKTSGNAPLTVTFDNNSVGAVSYLWTFEPGVTSTANAPIHTFAADGNYPVTLVVTSDAGCKDTFTLNISVNTALLSMACFTYTKGNGGIAPSEVIFNSSCSQNAASYLWDFGYLDSISGVNYSSTESNPNHVFARPGRYDVKLTTKNSDNISSDTINRIVICGPNSSLVNDSCLCDPGYEKDAEGLCTVDVRAKFVGNYIITEQCSLSSDTYTITVTQGTSISEVHINNFWGIFFNPVIATVSGTSITISLQEPDQDAFVVQGSGSIDTSQIPNVMTITYTVTDKSAMPNITDVCTNSMFVKL